MTQLAQQIRALRTPLRILPRWTGRKTLYFPSGCFQWENGEATPDIDKLVQLAEIFDVSLDYLVLGKELENNIKATGAYQTAEQKMDIWQFIAGYWWIVLSIWDIYLGFYLIFCHLFLDGKFSK